MVEKILEPHGLKSSCAYCGDAPISHSFSYVENLLAGVTNAHIHSVTNHAPEFLKSFVDWFTSFTFRTFVFFRLAHFSGDINKAKTFRSRVIWEEAIRRGIPMDQLILFDKPLDYYRAKIKSKYIYFNSLPLPPKAFDTKYNWDDKFVLKEKFSKENIPTPLSLRLPMRGGQKLEKIFSMFSKPIIVKPKVGSRGRHTITNIHTFAQFEKAITVAKVISPNLVAEEHLHGYVCRATLVEGELLGFYRGEAPYITGDGAKSILELIEARNKARPERVEEIKMTEEIDEFISRSGYRAEDVLKNGEILNLSHRVGRLFGGHTREMLDELHPSFVPILKRAMDITELVVAGFDCIIPDPTKPADSQKWGIIECNTLPFIDLHYYALEGKPKNIAGAIWDFWN